MRRAGNLFLAIITSLLCIGPAGADTIDVRISTGMDDVEQRPDNSIYTNSSDLELAVDGSTSDTVGMRFQSIVIPQGSTISNAYIQFTCDETNTGACSLTIVGEDIDDAPAFTTASNNVGGRTTTTASVAWSPSGWSSVGASTANERTPDISTVIKEIVDRTGWSSGNDIVIIVTGTGKRIAESYDGSAGQAPLLHVEFTNTGGGGGTSDSDSYQIATGDDDVEQRTDNSMYMTSSDLELAIDDEPTDTVGMRFRSIGVPADSRIDSAYIQFTVDETDSGACSLTIHGEDIDDAPVFTTSSNNLGARTTTSASVAWSPPAWNSVGAAGADQQTPDLSTIIQEIVDRGGWASGNDMVIVVTGTGTRTAESYNGSSPDAPILELAWTEPGVAVAEHTAGQRPDAFTLAGSATNAELLSFTLSGYSAVTELVFDISEINGLTSGDWSGVEIVEDTDGDGHIGGGETTTIGGSGSVNVSAGTITFSTAISVDGSQEYVLRADFSSLSSRDTVTVALDSAGITGTGTMSGVTSSAVHSEFKFVGDLMFVVPNAASLGSYDTTKKAMFEGWKYRVVPISSTATQEEFDALAARSDVAFISEQVTSTDVGTKLKAASLGVVLGELALYDEFGIATSSATYSDTEIDIVDNTHYITSVFATGALEVLTSSGSLNATSGTSGGASVLGEQPSSTTDVITTLEVGAALAGGGTAAGRRVSLPFGYSNFDPSTLTGSGKKLLKRALEWAAGPLGHWKLDETSGTTAADTLGGHDGTVTGAVWATGQNDGGLDFSSDYVTVANAAAFQLTEKMTIAGWINGNSWGAGSNVNVILRKGDGNPNNYQLCVVDNVLAFMLDDSDGGGVRSATTLSTGQWYHVAATWDGERVRLYIDGVLDVDPAAARAAPIATDTRPVYLGGRPSTDYFDGILDDVCFFNRVLTPKELDLLAYPVSLKIVSWSEENPNP